MNTISKIICTVIAVSMLTASFTAASVIAAEATAVSEITAQSYEQVLEKVKSKITVSDKLTEFDIDTRYMADVGTRYYFNWNSDENDKFSYSNMSVSADENGNIMSYYYYDREKSKEEAGVRIADLSKEYIKSEIEIQLKRMIPEKFDKLEVHEEISSNGYEYNIRYWRVENGIKVSNNYVSVNAVVSGDEVVIRNLSTQWDNDEFTVPEIMIDESQAAEIYMDKARFCANYGTSYKAKNEYSAYLRYSFKNNVYIDAVTGELTEDDGYDIYVARNSAATKEMSVEDSAMGGGLTTAEQEEINKLAGLISYEAAEKKLRAIKELGISSEMKIADKSINKNGEEYIMQLGFSDGENYSYISLNAQSGDLFSASNYSDYNDSSDKISISDSQKNNAVKKITEFVQKYVPEYYKTTSPTDAEITDNQVAVKFERVYNGIPVGNDGISVVWDAVNDKFLSVYTTKFNITELPSADNIIDKKTAYEKVIQNAGFEKMYIKHNDKMTVAYGILDSGKASVDAFTGEMIDGSGKKIDTFDAYTDISGHWAEDIINTLAEYNIKKSGSEFKPEESITQKEFLMLLNTAKYSYVQNNENALYQQFVMEDIISKEDINPVGTVTKQQAVMYLLKIMGYANSAEIKGIFKCDFADISAVREDYFGYIAIAKGLGIVNGDESNNFNPEKNITNAEAAVIIYNYLKK